MTNTLPQSSLQRLNEAASEISRLQDQIDELQRNSLQFFKAYIADDTISVINRWNVFSRNPIYHDHSDWIFRSDVAASQYAVSNWFDAGEVYGRGKRIDIVELFNDSNQWNAFLEGGPIGETTVDNSDNPEMCITKMAEDLMAKNIGSFCFDW